MIERRAQPDTRDTGLDIAEIGAQVRDQLKSLAQQTPHNTLVQEWLRELEQNPNAITENFRAIFLFMRGLHQDHLAEKLDAWEERLTQVN